MSIFENSFLLVIVLDELISYIKICNLGIFKNASQGLGSSSVVSACLACTVFDHSTKKKT
jgi:hypothetical protein